MYILLPVSPFRKRKRGRERVVEVLQFIWWTYDALVLYMMTLAVCISIFACALLFLSFSSRCHTGESERERETDRTKDNLCTTGQRATTTANLLQAWEGKRVTNGSSWRSFSLFSLFLFFSLSLSLSLTYSLLCLVLFGVGWSVGSKEKERERGTKKATNLGKNRSTLFLTRDSEKREKETWFTCIASSLLFCWSAMRESESKRERKREREKSLL